VLLSFSVNMTVSPWMKVLWHGMMLHTVGLNYAK
jgi:hypothetical protein